MSDPSPSWTVLSTALAGADGRDRLWGWLQGYEFPKTEPDLEPYEMLARAIPRGAEQAPAENTLAVDAALLLEQKPDVTRPGRRPEQALYNLLQLCAYLARADVLGEPLWNMYERHALDGEWHGTALANALRYALAYNQLDDRLHGAWRRLLTDAPEYAVGTPFDGFVGVVQMPASPVQRGTPHKEAIGEALVLMAGQLTGRTDRRGAFQSLLTRVHDTFPNWEKSFDLDMILLADTWGWPRWAVESLPTLVVPCEEDLYIWTPLYQVSEEVTTQRFSPIRQVCDDLIVRTKVPKDARLDQILEAFRPFDHIRRQNPYTSERSSIRVMLNALGVLPSERYARARSKLLKMCEERPAP